MEAFISFLMFLLTMMIGAAAYLYRKQEASDQVWKRRMEAKIDEMSERVFAAFDNYILLEEHQGVHRVIKERLDDHTHRLVALENAIFRKAVIAHPSRKSGEYSEE